MVLYTKQVFFNAAIEVEVLIREESKEGKPEC